MHKIILGSTSPRRKEIMNFFSLPFTQVSSPFDESQVPYLKDPIAYVCKLAEEKAKALKDAYHDSIILTADTMVFIDGELLGKPKDEKETVEMLTKLSGRWHSVFTAVAVTTQATTFCEAEETKVHCNTLSIDDIHRYMRAHSLTDKAGAYAIQKSGSMLVKEINGCYYNVMGLPINTVRKLLFKAGIDLWDYLKPF